MFKCFTMTDSGSEGLSNNFPKEKKKRSANFTSNETFLLMSLVSELKHIIENKKTDGVSMQEKNMARKKKTKSFNSVCPESRHRTMESLKKLYDNKKRDVRKQKAEEKKDILLTGGGPSQKILKDPTQDLILSIVDPLTVVGGPSYYGSDSLQFPKSNQENQNDDYFSFELENARGQNMKENFVNIDQEEPATIQLTLEDNERFTNTTKTNWKTGSDLMKPIASPLKRHREVLASPNLSNKTTICGEKNEEKDTIDSNITQNNNYSNQAKINHKPLNRRRPTETVVRSLASSQLCQKYDQLVDKKKVTADYILKKLKLEIEQSKEEHKVKMQILNLDLEIKKQQFNSNQK